MSGKFSTLGNLLAGVFTAVQIDAVGIENAISIICLILTCLSVALSIVSKVVSWYNKSKQDGHIDKDEIKELADDLNVIIKESKDDINRQK